VVVEEGEEAFAICRRVRRTSWGYVASDAIILEAAEHIRIVDGDREDWFPSGSVHQPLHYEADVGRWKEGKGGCRI
jgi:hypothetical protein